MTRSGSISVACRTVKYERAAAVPAVSSTSITRLVTTCFVRGVPSSCRITRRRRVASSSSAPWRAGPRVERKVPAAKSRATPSRSPASIRSAYPWIKSAMAARGSVIAAKVYSDIHVRGHVGAGEPWLEGGLGAALTYKVPGDRPTHDDGRALRRAGGRRRYLRHRRGLPSAEELPRSNVRHPRGTRRDRRHLGPLPLSRDPLRLGHVHPRILVQALDESEGHRRRPVNPRISPRDRGRARHRSED